MAATPDDILPLPHRILDAAEAILRRHGPEKTNVVDIAKALGMSHANVYRHYPSKKALLEAVAERWIGKLTAPLCVIVTSPEGTATGRLRAWFDALRSAKRKRLRDDPEMFRTHYFMIAESPDKVREHVDDLCRQVAEIISAGVAGGEFSDRIIPADAARAFLLATSPFHHPALLMHAPEPRDDDADKVFDLLLAGLKSGTVG